MNKLLELVNTLAKTLDESGLSDGEKTAALKLVTTIHDEVRAAHVWQVETPRVTTGVRP